MYYKSNLCVSEKNRINSLDRKFNISMKPMQLMQRLYNDYNRAKLYTTADAHYNYTATDAHYNKQRYKINYAQRMSKFLQSYQKSMRVNESAPSSVPTILNKNKFRLLTQQKYKASPSQESNRCYFKNAYANVHPLLLTTHNIEQKVINQSTYMKTQQNQQIRSSRLQNYQLMTPKQNRKNIDQLKSTMNKIKNKKKQINDKIRYNYLIHNAFKTDNGYHKANSILQSKERFSQVNTKERIFPQTTPINDKVVLSLVK